MGGEETTEDEMVGWHNQHDGHEFEQAPEVGEIIRFQFKILQRELGKLSPEENYWS